MGRNDTHLLNNTSRNQGMKTSSLRHRSDLLSKLEMDQTNISIDELAKAKEVQIKQKKVSMPKNVTDRYNTDTKNIISTKIITNSTLPIKKTEYNSTIDSNSANTARLKFPIKDILTDTSYKNLKSNLIKEKILKDKNARIDDTKFRTIYENKNYIEKLEQKLAREINPDRINLIKYLNEKKNISEVLINKLYQYDEEKINRVNKICQIVFHDEERSKMYQGLLNERLIVMKNKKKVDYKNSIETMGREMKGIASILKGYEKTVNNKERYRDIHNDIVKNYWRKYNVDFMQRKGDTKYAKGNNSSLNNSELIILNTNNNASKFPQTDSSVDLFK